MPQNTSKEIIPLPKVAIKEKVSCAALLRAIQSRDRCGLVASAPLGPSHPELLWEKIAASMLAARLAPS